MLRRRRRARSYLSCGALRRRCHYGLRPVDFAGAWPATGRGGVAGVEHRLDLRHPALAVHRGSDPRASDARGGPCSKHAAARFARSSGSSRAALRQRVPGRSSRSGTDLGAISLKPAEADLRSGMLRRDLLQAPRRHVRRSGLRPYAHRSSRAARLRSVPPWSIRRAQIRRELGRGGVARQVASDAPLRHRVARPGRPTPAASGAAVDGEEQWPPGTCHAPRSIASMVWTIQSEIWLLQAASGLSAAAGMPVWLGRRRPRRQPAAMNGFGRRTSRSASGSDAGDAASRRFARSPWRAPNGARTCR